jgi:hypothetical protein
MSSEALNSLSIDPSSSTIRSRWGLSLALTLAALAALLALYWQTGWSMVEIWWRSETFAHGFMILPISLYLIWLKRAELQALQPRASMIGLLALAIAACGWLAGHLVDVQVVEQLALVAMMIAELGVDKAEAIVRGWVANLAAAPFSNDTKAMQAVAAGRCDVTIVNTYYFGRLQNKQPGIALAIFWPNQQGSGDSGRGVHVNVSGAGVTANAPHRAEAIDLLEWFSTEQAQRLFADLNLEYPANPKVPPAAEVAAWGEFRADSINVAEAGRLQREAVMLMDRAGYR